MNIEKNLIQKIEGLLKIKILNFVSDPNFSSHKPNYRLRIRESIANFLSLDLSFAEKKEILDINKIPSLKKGYLSISHSHDYGAYIISPSRIGLDIEHLDRLSEKVILRISRPTELKHCPNPLFLWSAKESAFKVFLNDEKKITTVSQISITSWSKIDDALFFFEGSFLEKDPPVFHGILIQQSKSVLAISTKIA